MVVAGGNGPASAVWHGWSGAGICQASRHGSCPSAEAPFQTPVLFIEATEAHRTHAWDTVFGVLGLAPSFVDGMFSRSIAFEICTAHPSLAQRPDVGPSADLVFALFATWIL